MFLRSLRLIFVQLGAAVAVVVGAVDALHLVVATIEVEMLNF